MKKKLTTVAFNGTAEQEEKLLAVIAKYRDMEGAMMPILQDAQEIYGYLPIEVQTMVAEELGVSVEEVFGVATFYSQFVLNPKGEYPFAVCLGTACYVKGSGDVFNKLETVLGLKDGETTADGRFSLTATRCIGCCGLAPVMTVGDEVYGKVTTDQIPGIVAKYRD